MKKSWILIIAACLLLSGCGEQVWDMHSGGHNFNSFLGNAPAEDFAAAIDSAIKVSQTNTERAELVFLLSRVTNNKELASFAMDFFHKAAEDAENSDEKAILYESVAGIDDTRYNHLRSAEAWRKAKQNKRALIDFYIAAGLKTAWKFDIRDIDNGASFSRALSKLTIGNTAVELGKEDTIMSQAHRIVRDFTIPRLPSPYSGELLETPEAKAIGSLKAIGINHIVASGTLAKETDGRWYASNEEDIFMFEVPVSVIDQPTTRFLRKDIAVIVDTNGMATIARNVIEHNATAAFAGCDSNGDVKAAKYLSGKGIKVICSSGNMLPLLIGGKAQIVSAPFKIEGDNAVFGKMPMEISRYEPVIAMDYSGKDANLMHYSSPARYFGELEKKGAKMNYFLVEVFDAGQMDKLIKKANEKASKVVAASIYNEEDYNELKAWLEEKADRKVILFDTEANEYGYKLAREFRSQASFGDINPAVG